MACLRAALRLRSVPLFAPLGFLVYLAAPPAGLPAVHRFTGEVGQSGRWGSLNGRARFLKSRRILAHIMVPGDSWRIELEFGG